MTLCVRTAGAGSPRPIVLAILILAIVSLFPHPAVASGWSSRDIGAPVLAGSATVGISGIVIDAAGTDIGGTSDQFHFVYQAVSGDVDVKTLVADVTNADAGSRAGIMIRGALTASAAHGYVMVSAGNGQGFQRRTQTGGQTTSSAGGVVAPPRWLRLVRQGSRVTAYSSPNATSWTEMGSDTIALGQTAYVGIAVTSHQPAMRTTAIIVGTSVTTLSLPAGQASADIGAVAVAGGASYANGTYTLRGAGVDIWASADQFHYMYQQMTGDGTVVAHVTSLQYANSWSKVGVMIRETLSPDSPHGLALISAGKGYAFQRRVVQGALTDSTSGGAGAAPGWVRLVRAGSTFTASRSADGVAWTTMGSAAIPMGHTVYAGLAVTSRNAGMAVTAVVDQFQVTETAPVANKPPLVTLTSPAPLATHVEPADITLTASASDPEGSLLAVDFYSGSTLLARDTTAPYTYVWRSVPAGSYSVTAVAIDTAGGTAASPAVTVVVTAAASGGGGATGGGGTTTSGGGATGGGGTTTSGGGATGGGGTTTSGGGATGGGGATTSGGGATGGGGATTSGGGAAGGGGATGGGGAGGVPPPAAPRYVEFTASVNHDAAVTSYLLEVFVAGADPKTGTPIALSNLGKPTPAAGGLITVDRSAFFTAMAPGTYVAAVSAIGPGGKTVGVGITFTR